MSENVTVQQFIEILEKSNKPIFEKFANIEAKIDLATANINTSLISHAVLEAQQKNYELANKEKHIEFDKSLSQNWEKTRKIDAKIVKWSGIACGISIASGMFFKFGM